MTDVEIVNALKGEIRIGEHIDGFFADCISIELLKNILALIERLKRENKILSKNADTAFQDGLNESQDLYASQIKDKIKFEAIKEFAERICKGRVSNDPVVITVNVELEMMEENENDRA